MELRSELEELYECQKIFSSLSRASDSASAASSSASNIDFSCSSARRTETAFDSAVHLEASEDVALETSEGVGALSLRSLRKDRYASRSLPAVEMRDLMDEERISLHWMHIG